MRCCENNDLKMLICSLQTFDCIWSNINTGIDYFSVGEFNLEYNIRIVGLWIIDAMNKCFIKIKNNCFLMIVFWWREVYMLTLEIWIRRRSNWVDVLDRLKCLNEMSFMKFIFILIFLSCKLFRFSALRMLNRFVLTLFNWHSFDFLFLNQFNFCDKLIYRGFFSIFLKRSWSFIVRAFIRDVYYCILSFFNLIVIKRRSLVL